MPQTTLKRYKRDVGIEHTPLNRFTINIADRATDRRDAFSLLHNVYVNAGFQHNNKKTMRITDHHRLRESIVFIAREGSRTAGTITTTKDSSAQLPLDKDFPDVLEKLRAKGARLVELGSLAIEKESRGSGLNTLLCILGMWASRRLFDSTDTVVFGINPKAEAFFRDTWGAIRIADPKSHWEFGAPVLAMSVALRHLRQHLKKQFPVPLADGRGIHEHCCETPGPYFIPTGIINPSKKQHKVSELEMISGL